MEKELVRAKRVSDFEGWLTKEGWKLGDDGKWMHDDAFHGTTIEILPRIAGGAMRLTWFSGTLFIFSTYGMKRSLDFHNVIMAKSIDKDKE